MGSQTLSIQQAFELGYSHHTQGRLADAEKIYRQIIAVQPAHADAMHMLGVIALQVGQNSQAIDLISRAVASNPNAAEYRSNLGLALTRLGRIDDAIAMLNVAIQLKPAMGDAHNNLGNALRSAGKLDEAADAFRTAIRLNPQSGEAQSNLAITFRSLGRPAEAEAQYRLSVQSRPNLFEGHLGLAELLVSQHRVAEAIPFFQNAIRLKPRSAEAHEGLGNALRSISRFEEAIPAFQTAISINPSFFEAHNNLGISFRALGRLDEAIACFDKAILLQPNSAGAHSNRGNALKEQNRVDEAIVSHRRALELDPTIFEAYTNLGNTLKDIGQLPDAIEMHRKAVELAPQHSKLHSNLLYALYFDPAFTARQIHEEELAWARRHADPLKQFILPHANDRNLDRPVRIGYVSPDFREHCQAFFTLPLLRNHDRRQFHITCYSSVVRPDAITAQIRRHVDSWRDVAGLSDQTVADLIRTDQIDILIDLTLHMAGNRLLIFARKPAPVQVTWLGYPGSTGLDTIDYRITDRFLDPRDAQPGTYSEASWRLPDTFWCYDPLTSLPSVNMLPALQTGHITFGCLNNFSKVNRDVLKLWTEVLNAVPDSRILILADPCQQREQTLAICSKFGIDPARIEFPEKRPRLAYLELYHRIDITLDTFPYNGHTTSLDSLWMGVPVVSLVGDHPVARAGLTLNSNVNLPSLATESPAAYVERAAELCRDLHSLANLRSSLRSTMQASPLMDAPLFARNFESALRQMWREWCAKPTGPTS